MLIEGQIPNRLKNEKLILFLRRHYITLVGRCLIYFFAGLIPIGAYFFITNLQPQILQNQILYIFLFLLGSLYYLFTWLFIFNAFIDYYLDIWIVTDQRVINIEQKNMFNRQIAEQNLERIQDVSGTQKGIWQTFFSYGNVQVQTAGETQHFNFHNIDNPFEVVRIINNLIEKKQQAFEKQLYEKIERPVE
ncbi:MAG: hypothetical protein A2Y82_00815 [Candidatus Buchananbacteria bacterium RBG_13_36_9]|uniref:YdbS-like PH domain-containing protein n=1 Tax=Candidatus Buchananbacteria bacterium RBG_13_36_9 TaxID=1797530 RepID=A0A1G1XN90_9BACT|nr:MAG: hypothetical protein A2Y82_00815 [Candidatus Buchananbacteria bacterium RBG_13_36_9]